MEEHLHRFYTSAQIAKKEMVFSRKEIKSFLGTLISKNGVQAGNILISYKTHLKAFFVAHNYPDSVQYKKGVSCGVLHAERDNPNAKVFQTLVRKRANELIKENAFYEVLLVDHFGKVTEGSRSNVFFIKGNKIVTPPAKSVLLGITRQKTIECAKLIGNMVHEEDVSLEEIACYDAVFLTGTSPKVLPVNRVGEHTFDAGNGVLRRIMQEFDSYIDEYIKNTRK